MRRVAVTGMGIITAHGVGFETNLASMMEGRDGIREITSFDASGYRARTGGEAGPLGLDAPLKRLKAKRLDRSAVLVLKAFGEALEKAGLERMEKDCPVCLGTTLGGMISGLKYHAVVLEKGSGRARASLLTDYLAHCQAEDLKNEYGITGEAMTFSDACASGTNAIGYAFHKIRSGEVDIAVAGGYDTMCEFTFAGFNSLQAVTPTVCRPFDRARDGLVLGEGAGILILEELSAASARGARVFGEVIGFGASSDAYHSTRPDPEGRGASRAMRAAIEDARVYASEIDYVNAHGTGTPYNDHMEARAIREVFGSRRVPVSSIKPMVGHLLGGAGAVEAIVTLMSLQEGRIPPNINCVDPDPECGIEVVREPARSMMKRAVSNSFGFGGANASLVFQAAGV